LAKNPDEPKKELDTIRGLRYEMSVDI